MKCIAKMLLFPLFLGYINAANAQVSGNITVNGDIDKFYPVVFSDGGWLHNVATELEIGRSWVHQDSSWRGALIARFRFHTYNWGNGANFIDADIREDNINNPDHNMFIAGWKDGTTSNSDMKIVIWLRGKTTYDYTANYAVDPVVYDTGPYSETNGPVYSFKTAIDNAINPTGLSYNNTMYVNGSGVNYYAGSIGIGTLTTGSYKLAVEGAIGARKVKVTQAEGWPDYVFEEGYELPSLREVEKYVNENKHLPGVLTAAEVEKEGVDLGEMNKRLLQKIEELTLHLIEQQKRIEQLELYISTDKK